MDGAGMIVTERMRQVTEERWDWSHDDEHVSGELALAAVCYAMPTDLRQSVMTNWPWDEAWWKPTPEDRIRELVKAGALIAAEIDRLQRVIEENELSENERMDEMEDELERAKACLSEIAETRETHLAPLMARHTLRRLSE